MSENYQNPIFDSESDTTLGNAIVAENDLSVNDDPRLDPVLPSQLTSAQKLPSEHYMTLSDAMKQYRITQTTIEQRMKAPETHFWGNLAKGVGDFGKEIVTAPDKLGAAIVRAFDGHLWPDMTEDEAVRFMEASTQAISHDEQMRALVASYEGADDSVVRPFFQGAAQVCAYGLVAYLTGGLGVGAIAGIQEASDLSQSMAEVYMSRHGGSLKDYKGSEDAIFAAAHGALSGFIETKLGVERLFTDAIKKTGIRKIGEHIIQSAAGEGAEEFLQETSNYIFANLADRNDRTFGDFLKDATTNAVYGALLGGAFGGAMYYPNVRRIKKALTSRGYTEEQAAVLAPEIINGAKNAVLQEVDDRAQIREHYGEQWTNLKDKIVTALTNAGWKETNPNVNLEKYAEDNADDIVRPLFRYSNKYGVDTRDLIQLADIEVIDNALYLRPGELGTPEQISARIKEKQDEIKRQTMLARTGAGDPDLKQSLQTQVELLQKYYERQTGARYSAARRNRVGKARADAEILVNTEPAVAKTIANIDTAQMITGQPTTQIRERMDGNPFVYVGTKQLPVEYKVVPMSEVIASHIGQDVNPRYSLKELQNRAQRGSRTDVSILQSRAAKIQPENLGISYNTQNGAPIVNERGEVIAGNGRFEVIRMTDEAGRARYNKYLESLGLDLNGIENPVLVRVLHGLNAEQQIAIADASNVSATSAFDNASQAAQDMKLLTGTTGMTDFLNKIPIESRQGLFLANDRINRVALERRYNDALMMWLLNGDTKLYEDLYLMGGITPKIQTSLNQSIPALMSLESQYPDAGIRSDLAAALKRLPTMGRAQDFAMNISQSTIEDGRPNLFNENALLYALTFGKNAKTWTGTGAERTQVGLTLSEFFDTYTRTATTNRENVGKTDLFGQPLAIELTRADMLADTLTKAFPNEFVDGTAQGADMRAVFLTRAQTEPGPTQLSQIDLHDTIQPTLFPDDTSTASAVKNLPWERPVDVLNPIFFSRTPDATDIETARTQGYDSFLILGKNDVPTQLVLLDGSTVNLEPGAKIPSGKELYKPTQGQLFQTAYTGDTINIDGVERTVYNSNGDRIAQAVSAPTKPENPLPTVRFRDIVAKAKENSDRKVDVFYINPDGDVRKYGSYKLNESGKLVNSDGTRAQFSAIEASFFSKEEAEKSIDDYKKYKERLKKYYKEADAYEDRLFAEKKERYIKRFNQIKDNYLAKAVTPFSDSVIRYANYTDYYLGNIDAEAIRKTIYNELKKDGWMPYHSSGKRVASSSFYMKNKNGETIRVSDHELPMTEDRWNKSVDGDRFGWTYEFVITDKEINDMLKLKTRDGVMKYVYDTVGADEYSSKIETTDTIDTVSDMSGNIYHQGRRVNGFYDPELDVIVLGRNSNTGTLPHEMAHFWANTMFNLVKSGKYNDNPEFMAETMGMFQMLGVGMNQQTLTRDQQEQFATMTESVIFGMAPIPQGAQLPVTAFLNWVPEKYKSILDIGYRNSEGRIVNPILDKQAVDWFNAWYSNGALPSIGMSPLGAETANAQTGDRILPSETAVMKVRSVAMDAESKRIESAQKEQNKIAEEQTPTSELADIAGASVAIESEPGNIERSTPPAPQKKTITSYLRPGKGTNTREGMFAAARDYIAKDRAHAEEVAFGNPAEVVNDTGVDRGILIRALMEEYNRGDPEFAQLYHNLAETVSLAGKTPGLSNDMNFQYYLDAVRRITAGMEGTAAVKYAGTNNIAKARATFNSDIDAFIQEHANDILRAGPDTQQRETAIKKMFAEAAAKFGGDTASLQLKQEELRRGRSMKGTDRAVFMEWANREIRKMLKATPDTDVMNQIMEMSEKAEKARKYLDSDNVAEAVAAAKTVREWQMFVQSKDVPPTWLSKVIGSWYPKAMLYNINTHLVNLTGNTFNYGIVKVAVAAQYKQGNKVSRAELSAEKNRLHRLYDASLLNLAAMANPTSPTLLKGEQYNPREGKTTLGKVADFSMDWLGKEDARFRIGAYLDALGHIATADAAKTGQDPTALFKEYKKINQPKDSRAHAARLEALRISDIAVFQQDGRLAAMVKKSRDALNFGRDAYIGTLLAPFVKTPANIVEMGARALAAPITSTYHGLTGKWSIQDTLNTGYFAMACILTFALMADYEPPYEPPYRYDPDKPYDSFRIRGTNTWIKLDTFAAASIPLRIIASLATGKGLGLAGSVAELPLFGEIADSMTEAKRFEKDPYSQLTRFGANFAYNRLNTAVPAVARSIIAASHFGDLNLDEIDVGLPKTGIGRKIGRQYGLAGGDTTTNDILRIFFNRLKIYAE